MHTYRMSIHLLLTWRRCSHSNTETHQMLCQVSNCQFLDSSLRFDSRICHAGSRHRSISLVHWQDIKTNIGLHGVMFTVISDPSACRPGSHVVSADHPSACRLVSHVVSADHPSGCRPGSHVVSAAGVLQTSVLPRHLCTVPDPSIQLQLV